MSTHAATAPAALSSDSKSSACACSGKALGVGIAGIVATIIGLFISGGKVVAFSWLTGVTFWTAIAIGMLMLVMIHHILDASWSLVYRRQFEHGLAAFPWLALLFAPLVIVSWTGSHDLIWKWMNPDYVLANGHTVGHDPLYAKKAAFLNLPMFTAMTALCFIVWIWLSARLRKASFTQDSDGDLKWTFMNRKTAAFGLALGATTLTLASIYWVKSLDYHWFSTMFGVWFFANCVRGALAIGVLWILHLYNRGDLKGILNTNHLYSAGMLIFAFTVFWAYVTFSQYFLIWNANVPEETFWYNLREITREGAGNQWKWVGLFILFGHFLFPFLFLLSYKNKIIHSRLKFIVLWTLFTIAIDVIYNIAPAVKDYVTGEPKAFLSMSLLWTATSIIGVGGIFFWAYLKSFPKAKLIPIRDPRITECLTHHE
ncbi:MAG: hypothetical protein ABW223_05660 [Rariglobus sp.]